MKTLCTLALKGGTGKSATAVILAQYAALRRHQRVLFIDADTQANSSRPIKLNDATFLSSVPASHIFTQAGISVESSSLTLLEADMVGLRILEQQPSNRDEYATNFRNNVAALNDAFDICVIDTAPYPDIRLLSILVSSDYALSPLQLNQEAVSGMGTLLNDPQHGVRTIQGSPSLEAKLEFLGFLPNLVVQTKFQKENLMELLGHYGEYMFTGKDGRPMLIKQSTAVAESMASGVPIFQSAKSTSREAWKHMKPVFDEILARIGVEPEQPCNPSLPCLESRNA